MGINQSANNLEILQTIISINLCHSPTKQHMVKFFEAVLMDFIFQGIPQYFTQLFQNKIILIEVSQHKFKVTQNTVLMP